jgi:glycerol-3-phosphate acyltransferase PlsX
MMDTMPTDAPRIVLDAMGGDYAPGAAVAGVAQAVRDLGVELILVGPEDVVRRELAKHPLGAQSSDPVPRIVDAPEVIGMAEHPVSAVRSKRRSSIVVGLDLVARGEADAFVTAGNTGATMAAAVLGLKRLDGVERPALATAFPTATGACLLLDVGANADARAEHLVQFAIMGTAYAEHVLGKREPRVALLNIGEEETKGSLLVQEAHQLLGQAPIHFIGNVEGKDIPAGLADVVVTDGFVGNVLIKFAEGVSTNILRVIREEIRANLWSTLLALGLRPAFSRVRRRMDYAEWGGAPLLGVNGICIIGHGRSNPRAVRNAIRAAKQAVEQDLIAHIRAGIGPQGSGARGQGPEVEHDRAPMPLAEEAAAPSDPRPLAPGP